MNQLAALARELPPHQRLISGPEAQVLEQVRNGTRSMQFRRASPIYAIGDTAWVVVEPTHLMRARRPIWPWFALAVLILAGAVWFVATYATVIVLAIGAGTAVAIAGVRRARPAGDVHVQVGVHVGR